MKTWIKRMVEAAGVEPAVCVCILLPVLVLASPQTTSAQRLALPTGAFLAAQVADLATTHQAIASGRGAEANGAMQGSDGKRVAMKAGMSAGVVGLTQLLAHKGHPTAAKVMLWSMTAVVSSVSVHNARVGR